MRSDSGKETRAPWSYGGERGPARWGELDATYALCAIGECQSPIDLTGAEEADLPSVEVSYPPAFGLEAENTGSSVEVFSPGGSSIALDGKRYELVQFHHHAPGEHALEGKAFPLELHFVHQAEDGELAVLGIFAEEGRENPAFAPIVEALPPHAGERAPVAAEVAVLDMLPADPQTGPRFTYEGSLTTPPCSEGVRWVVYATPIELSRDQLERFRAVHAGNSRPLQPLNGRKLLKSR